MTVVSLTDHPCDRCGRRAELHPWRFTASIMYRGKKIDFPWLCGRCFLSAKERFWKLDQVRR